MMVHRTSIESIPVF